jgi:arsenite transporter
MVPWAMLVLSVMLYIVVPALISVVCAMSCSLEAAPDALQRLLRRLGPMSLAALLLYFGFQG